MKISYNWLQDLIKEKLPQPEKLADLLTMHSFETELAEKKKNDFLFEVDVLPNRAHDCLSHSGIAREICAILNYSFKENDYSEKIKSSSKTINDVLKVEVEEKKLCPRYTARGVEEVKIADSPQWIKERLEICGLRPINNLVDIANYVMLETGQPLHAFDADKMKSKSKKKSIIVRKARKGEKIVSLDNDKYVLNENILVIADEDNSLCIAGIKGGKNPEIDKKTKRVFLEAANFNPQNIRKASQKLKLKTDASWRFEHQLSADLTQQAIDMAAFLIQDICQGKVLKGTIDIYSEKDKERKVDLDLEMVNSLLGINISANQIADIFKRLGFNFKNLKNSFQVIIPAKRLDISIPEDLIEEIGRLYGYEKISSQLPSAVLVPSERNEELVYQNKIREYFTGLGFDEAYNYSFVSEKDLDKSRSVVEVANPVSLEQKYLRPNLVVNLLKNVKENKKSFEEVKIFELGKVFNLEKGKVKEDKRMAAIVSSNSNHPFYYLKGIIDGFLSRLSISSQWYDDAINGNSLIPGFYRNSRRAEIKVDNELIGWIGEVNEKTAAFELFFDKIVELAIEETIYLPPSKYPSSVRDIAVLVDLETRVSEVLNLINQAGGELVADVDLFDMYEGENIPGGRKNFAFHIIYQSDKKTLTDKEVDKVQQKIIKALEEQGDWEVRK